MWGGIDDLAQALHDAPDILPKLRVYFIGGPNKMWSVDAYDYIEQHHPEAVDDRGELPRIAAGSPAAIRRASGAIPAFVDSHIRGRGALGDYFATHLNGTIKMGDTPSVVYLLHDAATANDPTRPSWGGTFVRIWDGRKTAFDRLTTEADTAEAFGVVEFTLSAACRRALRHDHDTKMIIDGRIPAQAMRRSSHSSTAAAANYVSGSRRATRRSGPT